MADRRIFVAGHGGLVGSAIVGRLTRASGVEVLTASRSELDLRDQRAVAAWFEAHQPDEVVVAAGTVGGIAANVARPAEFLYDNLMIHASVVHAAHRSGVRKLRPSPSRRCSPVRWSPPTRPTPSPRSQV